MEFVAVDLPEANKLTIHILSAMAEYECDMIRARTKAALAAAKARGVRLGSDRKGAVSVIAKHAAKGKPRHPNASTDAGQGS